RCASRPKCAIPRSCSSSAIVAIAIFRRAYSLADSASGSSLRGVLLLVGACVSFAVLDSIAKYLAQTHHPFMVAWTRYLFHVLLMAALFMPGMGRSLMRTQRPGLQIVRGVCLGMTSVCFFTSIVYMPLAEATAIVAISPILVTV